MGNKVNPTGIRIGVNKAHLSTWFASSKKQYAEFILQDHKANTYLQKILGPAGIDSIVINHATNNVEVIINVARPGVVIGRGGKAIDEHKKYLNKIYKKKVDIKIVEVQSPDSSAAIIGYNVGEQCVRRVPPKVAIQKEIAKVKMSKGVKGVKISVSGRIKGAEIARTEKYSWGSVPLHTLRSDIDYAFHEVRVPNAGLHGIHVWVYKGEKLSVSDE